MDTTALSSAVTGKTIRFSWKDGPTKGMTHEHVFHEDGTVEWHSVDPSGSRERAAPAHAERPRFVDEGIADGIRLVSYLSSSGYTLTVVLNYDNGSIAGVASNEKSWTPIHGTFEVVT